MARKKIIFIKKIINVWSKNKKFGEGIKRALIFSKLYWSHTIF